MRVAWEQDYYDVYEAARVLEIPPARVRRMLRSGELQGKRCEPLVEGASGPWRLPAGAVHAARSVAGASDAEETVAMPSEGAAPEDAAVTSGEVPSETSERLSEGVQDLREKAEAVIAGLEALEGRLEAAEMEQLALKEELRRSEERSEGLRAELERERARAGPGGQCQEGRPAWRRWLGGQARSPGSKHLPPSGGRPYSTRHAALTEAILPTPRERGSSKDGNARLVVVGLSSVKRHPGRPAGDRRLRRTRSGGRPSPAVRPFLRPP